jgi:hypothetical protein
VAFEMNELEAVAEAALNVVIPNEVQKFFRRRADETTRLIIEELRTAKVEPESVAQSESIAGMCAATYLAMAQGAAFRNLAVIAKVLAHKAAHLNENTDDFLAWVNAIAGLRHEEAVLLATLHETTENAKKNHYSLDKEHSDAMAETKRRLVGPGRLITCEDEFQAMCGALTRTGFVILVSGFGSLSAAPAPRLAELARMAGLQAWADEQNSSQ